jgi:hypothetical protein
MNYVYKILLRNDNLTNWNLSGSTIVLDKGEIGIAYDYLGNNFQGLKIGNGVSDWNTLPYLFDNLVYYYTKDQVNNTTGLTNYYLSSQLYTSENVDEILQNNYYTNTQLNNLFNDFVTTTGLTNILNDYYTKDDIISQSDNYVLQTYFGTVINSLSGRNDFQYYYLKTETDNLYLLKNSGYTINTNIIQGSDFYTLSIINNNVLLQNNNLLNLEVTSSNSPISRTIFSKNNSDGEIITIHTIANYVGFNTLIVPITSIPMIVGNKSETKVSISNRAIMTVGYYGLSTDTQQGKNAGIVGIAQNAAISNIGVVGAANCNETQLKTLDGGINGTGVYAYNPNLDGNALIIDGKIFTNGHNTYSGDINISGTIIHVNNGLIIGIN